MNLEQELKIAAERERPNQTLIETTIQSMEAEPLRKAPALLKPVLIAAVLIIALVGTAYAAGWLPAWTNRYAEDFGDTPDQKALIEEMGIPIGASQTAGEITVTAESMLSDGETIVIMLSAKRDNGEPLVPEGAEGFEHLIFTSGPTSQTPGISSAVRVREPVIYFKDYTPGETEAYYFGYFVIEGGDPKELELDMNSLSAWYNDREEILTEDPFAEWRLTIPLQAGDTRKRLAADVTVEAGDETCQLEGLYVSPLAVVAKYDVISTKPSERRIDLENGATWQMDFLQDLTLKLRLKSGEEIDMSIMKDNNGIENLMGVVHVDEEGDAFRITQGGVLPRIIPLEEMDCVIINGNEYPVS